MRTANQGYTVSATFIFLYLIFQQNIVFAISNDDLRYNHLLDSVEILKFKGFYNEAILLANDVKNQSAKQQNWPAHVRSLVELADVKRFTFYYSQDHKTIEEAFELFQLGEKLIGDHLSPDHIVLSRFYINKGKLIRDELRSSNQSNSDTLNYYFNNALAVIQKNSNNHTEAAKLYYELGYYHNASSNISLAEKYYNQLLAELSRFDELNYFRAYYLYRAHQFFYQTADYEKSLLCANIALHIFEHPKHGDTSNSLNCRLGIAAVYFDSNLNSSYGYSKALSHFQKVYQVLSEDFNDPNLSYITLYNIGVSHFHLQQYDSSFYYLKKSAEQNPLSTVSDSIQMARTKIYFGVEDLMKNENASAEKFFDEAMESYRRFIGDKHYETHVSYRIIGEAYEKTSDYDMALQHYQNGLVALYENFNSNNIYDNPVWETIENTEPALFILFRKAGTLFSRYINDGKIEDLDVAFEIYLSGYNLMQELLNSQKMNQSYVSSFQNFKKGFQESVECAIEAHAQLKKPKYLNGAFSFIEQSKYFLLLKAMQNAELKEKLGENITLFDAERSLSSEIEMLKHQLNRAGQMPPDKAFEIQNSLLAKVVEKTELSGFIHQSAERTNANLFHQHVSLAIVQDEILDDHEMVIEYFSGKDFILALAISKENVSTFKIFKTKELIGNITDYRKSLATAEVNQKSYKDFVKSSYFLYHHLFEPIVMSLPELEESHIKRFTIISDDELAYLPFEAFTTQKADSSQINYWGMPYLCKEVTLNYALSMNILYSNLRNKGKGRNSKILAMSYSPFLENESDFERMKKENELPYSAKEIKQIPEIFNNAQCDILKEASEQEFKSVAHNYSIIHLALHGQSDTINQYNSKLIFKTNPDSQDDGQLHAYELYNLDLSQTQLAILSSCETGLGKQIEGEGLFSIARGFAYAGCPSIVMSLWKVNDKSTSLLMKSYYENLAESEEKDVALQHAKISYIEHADELAAHPAYWAAFIAIGNKNPIEFSNTRYLSLYIAVGFSLLLVGFVFIRYRGKN